jgi:hypothetical protein
MREFLYTDKLRRLRDAVRRKSPGQWGADSWFLLHDNVPANWSFLVKDFFAKNYMTTREH